MAAAEAAAGAAVVVTCEIGTATGEEALAPAPNRNAEACTGEVEASGPNSEHGMELAAAEEAPAAAVKLVAAALTDPDVTGVPDIAVNGGCGALLPDMPASESAGDGEPVTMASGVELAALLLLLLLMLAPLRPVGVIVVGEMLAGMPGAVAGGAASAAVAAWLVGTGEMDMRVAVEGEGEGVGERVGGPPCGTNGEEKEEGGKTVLAVAGVEAVKPEASEKSRGAGD